MYLSTRSYRLSCILFALACACSDSDQPAEGMKPRDGDGPLYLASARIWDASSTTDSSTTSYLHLVPSIDSDTEVDTSQAIELNGAAKLFSNGENRWFAVGGGEEPTITRYTLDSRGRLKKGDSISLQPHGVTSLWDALYFVSPEQAYYPDTEGSQLIRWNPTTMEVLDAIPLPVTAREGFISYYSMEAIVRDGLLIFSVGWFDWEETDSIRPETGLVVFDTEKDELVTFETDSRCGGITQALQLDSGDTYFVSSALAGATYALDRLETEPCALKLAKDATEFAPDYLVHLRDLTDGAIAGEPVPAGGDALFLRVFDEGEAEVMDGAKTYELTGQAVWSWTRWDVESNELTPVDLPASTADTFWFVVDDKVLASETTDDYSETTLIDLTADGGPERTLTVPGFLQNIARVR